ncbi:ABC transport system-associated protein [Corynebacterium resistens DSM 45100]|uniref:ABC transport system-associated protein n=1 Tax=Corynebacterium resistens (strain DSM 45100 / JCM 12819 / GTC 2026 / SICGH 158) TaxID=662755 RepID=F8E2D4_CORRG|nr:choice-of-anchor M domain-containing protein [Corynebacterium resistens]AEI10252.1 ABC transport system-associated protein [Corynebacterium resistens DSM 45100]
MKKNNSPLTIRAAAVVTALALGATTAVVPAQGAPGEGGAASSQSDPALKQTVKDDERFAPRGQKHAFTKGHADLGVRLEGDGAKGGSSEGNDGGLTMMLRDDSKEQPVWRHLEDVAFVVGENSKQQLPEGGDYEFTGARAGQQVYVLPQTEKQGVPWLGWNTQSPELVKSVSRGVTMQLLGHQGPGQLTMFLQAGGFAKPQKIFSTGDSMPQGMWVDSNTHAHANWVFTEPGVHRVALGIRAKQADGKVLSGTKIVTFAVGVDAQEALSAGWQGEVPKTSAADDAATGSANGNSQGTEGNGDGQGKDSAAENSADSSTGSNTTRWVLLGAGVLLALVVIGGVISMRSGRSARREAEEQLRELREKRQAREQRAPRERRDNAQTRTAKERNENG